MKRINNKGITLIALIVTVIIMLILAAVVLNVVIGENGLIKLSIGTAKKSNEEAAKEKLQVELENLRTRKYADETYNENEYIDNYLKSKGMTVNSNIVIVDGIAFEIDRENLVILSRKQAYVIITSEIKEKLGNGIVNMLIKIESDTQIDTITFPNEDGTSSNLTTSELVFEKDLKVELSKEYTITVKTKDGKVTKKTILLEGDGTKEHPIIIRTKEELQAVNEDLSAYYKLGENINLTDFKFTPIGSTETPFTGNIDGTGYTISNLKIEDEENDNIGLFGNNNGTITNITLQNVTIKGKTNVGGLVGYNTGTATNCTVSGSVTGTGDNVGGLIGYVYAENKGITLSGNAAEVKVAGVNQVGGLIGNLYMYATVRDATYKLYVQQSYAIGDVGGVSNVGGLIGQQNAYTYQGLRAIGQIYIQECYATGNVKATENEAGGLVGYVCAYGNSSSNWDTRYYVDAYTIIENSFATGKVEGGDNVGGLIGYAQRQSNTGKKVTHAYIQITNTYAIGEVIGTEETAKVGGLVGTSSSSGSGSTTVTNSYWTPETTKQENSVLGSKNLIPYMIRKIGYDNWNFEEIWEIEEGKTIAYLKNVQKPESINKENITYEEFDIVGEGTRESPFIITKPIQLQKVSEKLASYYKLGANIDLTGRIWTPIGTEAAPFTGNIDGTGYTISNLSYDNEQGKNVGLFEYNNGTISNITLENVTIKGKTNVGSLVGYNNGTIANCIVRRNVTESSENVGGLVGYNIGTVTNCTVSGIVTGTGDNTGGLIGYNIGTVTNCTVSGIVTGTGDNTGGLIGYIYLDNARTITISGNGAGAKVTGTNQVGGLIGNLYVYATVRSATYKIYIQQSYATGDVEGVSNVGGLIGQQYANTYQGLYAIGQIYIQECYATGNVKATENKAGGLVGYVCAYVDSSSNWSNTYYVDAYTIIENSFATGKVEGGDNAGGLIGYVQRQSNPGKKATHAYIQITNIYAIGEVIGTGETANVGGLVGSATSSGGGNMTVTDSFWNTETTKQETSVLGIAADTASMTGTELYTNWSSDVWTIEQGQYPKLKF